MYAQSASCSFVPFVLTTTFFSILSQASYEINECCTLRRVSGARVGLSFFTLLSSLLCSVAVIVRLHMPLRIPKACISIAPLHQARNMSTATKYPLGSLPLPPPSNTLTKHLTADKTATSPKEFHRIQREKPSTQRRARILSPETHFSYVAPNPLPFPYSIVPEEGEEVTPENQSGLIERWLAKKEALQDKDTTERPNGLHVYYPAEKEMPRELIGLSETGLRDCLPHLDVGDAFDIIGEPHLTEDAASQVPEKPENTPRQELVDILSGYATLKNVEENMNKSWAPWSLRYSGHQFGTWAGQLGDGRAISIRESCDWWSAAWA